MASAMCRVLRAFAALGALHSSGAFVALTRPATTTHWLRTAASPTATSTATTIGHQPRPRGSLLKGFAVDAASSELNEVQTGAEEAVRNENSVAETSTLADESPEVLADTNGGAEALEEVEDEEIVESNARTVWSKEEIVGSEWKIGIMWEGNSKPQETWIRFKEGFELEWGVNARGTWDLDGQFLSFSRDFALGWGGKRLFAAKLTQKQNEVYVEGVVRGWTPLVPASVMGQWQAIRLGVDRTPYGIPFWNTPEYAERVKAENAALEAERAAVIAGGAPSPAEEEPEPFWSGLVTGAAEVKNALAPPGTPTGDAIAKAMANAGVETSSTPEAKADTPSPPPPGEATAAAAVGEEQEQEQEAPTVAATGEITGGNSEDAEDEAKAATDESLQPSGAQSNGEKNE